ncbi:MAG: hypothetical protein A2600_06055 [Candidatus Lambdaproteobacteria bacterium RIFOXYD1_FULL_56_27]|nr:MAG: hypothetical protein A2600_06055 [Candidatus Lambdaproteobacteria bacterium RIFOXYD1_FULL_56_27]
MIAQELPNCFHFRLIAPLEHRIKSYMLRTGCTKDDAASAVLEAHANTSTFSKDFLGVDLTDPLYYHAIFNTERMKLSSIAVAVSKVIGY